MDCDLEDNLTSLFFNISSCQWVCRPKEMKTFCWNVHRLGSPRAARRLQCMLKIYYPQIVFFMETKLNANRMENVRRQCGFFNSVDVLADGTHEGLSIGWNGGHLVTLRSLLKNHINVEIQEVEESPRWRFTCFYEALDVRDKLVT
ncbi:hypothetical protein V6Z12_D04G106400 [Gossypium hirsutum]